MSQQEWQGPTPVFLVIRDDEHYTVAIDLDEPQWMKTYSTWMRVPGVWELLDKTGRVWLRVRVFAGDQPYYTARHVGITGSGGSNEITAFGIGKQQANGDMVRLWLMPDGTVVGGDDCDPLGVEMVKFLGPK